MKHYDIICVGGGIMSTTLAMLLKTFDQTLNVAIVERLDDVALESSGAWNNAGTGHSALCELNYTPMDDNGNVNIDKALKIFEQFEVSRQFWAYLKQNNLIDNPNVFVNPVPHHSWVVGADDVNFLQARYEKLSKHPFFAEMQFTTSVEQMSKWFPLITDGRSEDEVMAATRMISGTELNYQELAKIYQKALVENYGVEILTGHEVKNVKAKGNDWTVEVKNLSNGSNLSLDTEHVFVGAGGAALTILQKIGLKEKNGYGGFPVGGQWLVCKNEDIIEQHDAKVYSKAGPDAPPMSTPHLDTRVINGKKELLFGPFAGFSTKFLKEGSMLDLPLSIRLDNIKPMLDTFWSNLALTKYLIQQVSMGHEDKMKELRKFDKDAKSEDWELKIAGQRVQIIKKNEDGKGILQFGTEVITNDNGSITALLGASPGASVAVDVMMRVIEHAFGERVKGDWKTKIDEVFPFYNTKPEENFEGYMTLREENIKTLNLEYNA